MKMTYAQSLEILKQHIKEWKGVEKVAITQALDRIIAVDIVATQDYPAKQSASMDGYAFAWSENLHSLKLIDKLPAGSKAQCTPKRGECVKSYTGSLISPDCDTLIPIENVEQNGDEIIITKPVTKGFAVRKKGESYQKGDILIKKGSRLDFAQIAILAGLGLFHISVFLPPRVAIISTGSEIKDLGEKLENEAQIYAQNHIALSALVQKFGGQAVLCELVKDDKTAIKTAMQNALNTADILVTTGGVSVGDFDFVKEILKEYEPIINGVAIKPGRHIKVAKCGEKFIFALPGFAYSAVVTFVLFAGVLFDTWFGQKSRYIKAIMDDEYKKVSPFLEFVAVNLEQKDAKIYANFKGKKQGSSAIINNLAQNSALLVVPIEEKTIQKGQIVDVLMINQI
ncbi:MAG: molybdopterin molybdotransferase MoeA [Campylobacter sp.]|nr:molybdopterin molybdotransferase MoeA [Campylobacter sp.]